MKQQAKRSTNEVSHTPTPWSISESEGNDLLPLFRLVNEDGEVAGQTRRTANADFIVRAVNAHQDLIRTVDRLMNRLQEGKKLTHAESLEIIALLARAERDVKAEVK